jgi:hypothetical protein
VDGGFVDDGSGSDDLGRDMGTLCGRDCEKARTDVLLVSDSGDDDAHDDADGQEMLDDSSSADDDDDDDGAVSG